MRPSKCIQWTKSLFKYLKKYINKNYIFGLVDLQMTSRWPSGVKLYVVTALYKIVRPYRCQLELLPYSTLTFYQHICKLHFGGVSCRLYKNAPNFKHRSNFPDRSEYFENVILDKITLPMSNFRRYQPWIESSALIDSNQKNNTSKLKHCFEIKAV